MSLTSVALDPATANSPDADAARPDAMRCEFDTELGGQYRLTAVVTDGDGRHNRSEMTVWVTGADTAPNRSVTQETVTMVPDADSYAPGDTAQLLVQAPFAPASGLVTVSRGGIVLDPDIRSLRRQRRPRHRSRGGVDPQRHRAGRHGRHRRAAGRRRHPPARCAARPPSPPASSTSPSHR